LLRTIGAPRRVGGALYRGFGVSPGDIRKLEGGADEWRLRARDWRVIFARGPAGDIHDLRVVNRRDAYD
jgi:hypothetical protein